MSDETEAVSAASDPVVVSDPKHDLALSIYTTWRNEYMNHLPGDVFTRMESASVHLVAAIVDHL